MIYLLTAFSVLTVIIILILFLTGENERINSFIRMYKYCVTKHPEMGERDIKEVICEMHIPPEKGKTLKSLGMSGQWYLDEIFEGKVIPMKDLIVHFIALEFPKKYSSEIDLKKIRERNRKGLKRPREILSGKVSEKLNKFRHSQEIDNA